MILESDIVFDKTSNVNKVFLDYIKKHYNKEKLDIDFIEMACVYREMKKIFPDTSPENMNNISIQSYTSKQITTDDLKEMEFIIKMNYGNNPKYVSGLLSFLKKSIENEGTEWNILKFKGKIVGFLRLNEHEDLLYLGSFNLSPSAASSGLGGKLLSYVLDKYSDRIIKLHVKVDNPVLNQYFSQGGVVVGHEIGESGGDFFIFKFNKNLRNHLSNKNTKYFDSGYSREDIQKIIAGGAVITGINIKNGQFSSCGVASRDEVMLDLAA